MKTVNILDKQKQHDLAGFMYTRYTAVYQIERLQRRLLMHTATTAVDAACVVHSPKDASRRTAHSCDIHRKTTTHVKQTSVMQRHSHLFDVRR